MRALRISLVVLAVLAGLFTGADRVAVLLVEGEIASRAHRGLELAEEPDASVKGFPFLTQVAGGELDRVDLGITDYEAQVDGQSLNVERLDLRLHGVELSDGYSRAVAVRADGTGLIGYAELSRAYGELLEVGAGGFGVTFGYAGDGRLLLTLQAEVLGQRLDVGEITGDILLEGSSVRLEVDESELPDAAPEQLRQAVREQTRVQRTLSGLPDGLSLESVRPVEDGLELGITGTAVDLTR